MTTPNNISNNISATASNHFPQFPMSPDISSNPTSTKLNIFVRDWPIFDQENFILHYLIIDLEGLNKTNNGNINKSFVIFLTKFTLILDIYSSFF